MCTEVRNRILMFCPLTHQHTMYHCCAHQLSRTILKHPTRDLWYTSQDFPPVQANKTFSASRSPSSHLKIQFVAMALLRLLARCAVRHLDLSHQLSHPSWAPSMYLSLFTITSMQHYNRPHKIVAVGPRLMLLEGSHGLK